MVGMVTRVSVCGQSFLFPYGTGKKTVPLSQALPPLAEMLIKTETSTNRLFRLQAVAGKYTDALQTIQTHRKNIRGKSPYPNGQLYIQYEIFVVGKARQAATGAPFETVFGETLGEYISRWDDVTVAKNEAVFASDLDELQADLQRQTKRLENKDSITATDAMDLCNAYFLYTAYTAMMPVAQNVWAQENRKRYHMDNVLIHTKEGIKINAIVVRNKKITTPQPTALTFTIYTDDFIAGLAKVAAARGYVGVVAYSRGKALSPDQVAPYEYESTDVNGVIDWISRQPWSNGEVGMYGGSYNGFAQWAAAKKMHPALKTIVPYVASVPGLGLPMENNVFLTANYGWAFYVTNNKYLDDKVYFDPQRWHNLASRWYASGAPFRHIDSVDGVPNPYLQRWLQHPDYDAYWQNMVPYRHDFAQINIPVLSITGYYDDNSLCALHYFREHYRYNKNANHYFLIGPYDHFGAQWIPNAHIRGYDIDSAAFIDTPEITFQWFDHIFRNGPRPVLLKDKINYEVMGANEWKHAHGIDKMHNAMLTFYLGNHKTGDYYPLLSQKPEAGFLTQEIDFADRTTFHNNYYPDPIISEAVDLTSGLAFISEPFDAPLAVSGSFVGELKAEINKKDMDVGIVLYEVMPDGRFFHLSYFIGRASYANDMATRTLLQPNRKATIPFERVRLTSKQLSRGSRLLVVLDINKNAGAQINYGTGKDVSDESILDAKEPLRVKWFTDSYIRVPVWK